MKLTNIESTKVLFMEALPVELLHRIFDYLDVETIVLSIRLVSPLFRSVVGTYDRYVFDGTSLSKQRFSFLCRFLKPQSIISF